MTRGRRDNGLDAALWTPLRDVDPRVGEHLLDLLREAGIAAYLEPAADVGPYTRTLFLPSPPSDRLWVDRARGAEARGLVDRNADELPAAAPRERPLRHDGAKDRWKELRKDLDEEAEWARIVAALEAEQRPAVVGEEQPVAAPAPPPPEPELPEEHYEPPPPPPLRAPAPASLYAVLLITAGALLVGVPNLLGLSFDAGIVLGFAGVVGGVAILVARMRDRPDDDGDDGAIV